MSQYNLNRIFKPRQVAVVGASEKPGSMGNALMKNLMEGGFPGKLLPVNPKYETVHGIPAVASVSDLETGVDLVIVSTPIQTVPGIVQECVEKKIGGAIVISAGGKEIGEKGKRNRSADLRYSLCRRTSYHRSELPGHCPAPQKTQRQFRHRNA